MRNLLFPRVMDNAYHGRGFALWLLGLLLLVKAAMGVNSILNGYTVATSADGIPLDAFSINALLIGLLIIGLAGSLREANKPVGARA
jgi:Ca2+/Na+ antiporter